MGDSGAWAHFRGQFVVGHLEPEALLVGAKNLVFLTEHVLRSDLHRRV